LRFVTDPLNFAAMHQSLLLKTLNTLVFYTSLILLLTSCWQRNDFPEDMSVTPALLKPPVQRAVNTPPFTVANNGTDYRIEPRYQYDLHGLVVSYAHHNGNYSLHRLWNDHINVADVCVVWSGNANGSDLNHFKFWLVNYSNDDGFSRGTSTTRDDSGNGACETIYLKQFEILQPLDNGWRTLMSLALAGVIGSSLLWLVAVMRGRF
jgi:hypothetical protein